MKLAKTARWELKTALICYLFYGWMERDWEGQQRRHEPRGNGILQSQGLQ